MNETTKKPMAEVATSEFKCAIEFEHGGIATFLHSAPVHVKHRDQTGWAGKVHVFLLETQSKYSTSYFTVYTWSDELPNGERRLSNALATSLAPKPEDAVRAAIVKALRAKEKKESVKRRMAQANKDAQDAKAWAKASKSATSLEGPMTPVNGQAGGWRKSSR
ncbi:MAG TPA: hypothetical protein VG501_07120 [Rhizomicrobium sp.]|nr:hypothetical protein [Rhizomicrobium sp.]